MSEDQVERPVEKVWLPVEGMSCASCALSVEKALGDVANVGAARVNYGAEGAEVEIRGDIDFARIKAALRGRGYDLSTTVELLASPDVVDTATAGRLQRTLAALPGVVSVEVQADGTASLVGVNGLFDRSETIRAATAAGFALDWSSDPNVDPQQAMRERQIATLRREVTFAAVLSSVVFVLSMTGLFPFVEVIPELVRLWIVAVMTGAVLVFSGHRFFVGAAKAMRHLTPDMNTLVAMGTGSAFVFSLAVLVMMTAGVDLQAGMEVGMTGTATYFDGAAVIVTLILLGRWLEARAKGRTGAAIRKLLELGVKTALRLDADGKEEEVPIDAVVKGDRLRVKPGGRVPVDGVVHAGRGTLDTSMVTGEPIPREVGQGDEVIGGTVCVAGTFVLEATRVGADTTLARIVGLVRQAQGSRAPVQALVDRVAAIFVPIVLGVAVLALVLWLVFGPGIGAALTAFVTVLIIACPCSLGLATPTAIMVGTGRAAELGVLIRDAAVLEKAVRMTAIVLDKTGTITRGRPELLDAALATGVEGMDVDRLLTLVAAVARRSEHPLAGALVTEAERRGLEALAPLEGSFEAIPGHGMGAIVDGHEIAVGNAALFDMAGLTLPEELVAVGADLASRGASLVFVAVDERPVGVVGLADAPRETSAAAIAALRSMGIEVTMLTGDGEVAAKAVAALVGVDRVIADVRPEDKARVLRRLRRGLDPLGRDGDEQAPPTVVVGMVGDGVNDAPALAEADVGIAIGTGTDIAIEASDVTLMRGDLDGVVTAIRISRSTVRIIRQNLFWAFVYNTIGIPIAAGALFPLFHLLLSPMLAGAAMAMSSVSVVTNSLRLRRAR